TLGLLSVGLPAAQRRLGLIRITIHAFQTATQAIVHAVSFAETKQPLEVDIFITDRKRGSSEKVWQAIAKQLLIFGIDYTVAIGVVEACISRTKRTIFVVL